MKKNIIAVLLFATSPIFACSSCVCPWLLDIVINNQTSSECRIFQQVIAQGQVYSKSVPIVIPAGQTSKPYSIDVEDRTYIANVTLSYQCGDGQFATFTSERTLTRSFLFGDTETVKGTVLSLSNIDASYTTIPSDCNSYNTPRPNAIIWTLSAITP